MAHDEDKHENLDERLLHRMLFFTDAVFAIVMTLLVLELRPPDTAEGLTRHALASLIVHVAVFAMSFALSGVFWMAHMNTTRKLARFDWPTCLANLLFLLPVCLLPFASSWFGESPAGVQAWAFYCWVLIGASAGNMVLVTVAYRGGGRLILGGAPRGEGLYRLSRAAAPGVAFAIGLAMLNMGYTIPAHFCFAFIGPVFMLAELLLKPRTAKPAKAA